MGYNGQVTVGNNDLYYFTTNQRLDFEKSFGGGIEYKVIEEIKKLGFAIKGMDKKVQSLRVFNPDVSEKYGSGVQDDIIGRLVGIILWKRKDYETKFGGDK